MGFCQLDQSSFQGLLPLIKYSLRERLIDRFLSKVNR